MRRGREVGHEPQDDGFCLRERLAGEQRRGERAGERGRKLPVFDFHRYLLL
jgi:hypothetical protein